MRATPAAAAHGATPTVRSAKRNSKKSPEAFTHFGVFNKTTPVVSFATTVETADVNADASTPASKPVGQRRQRVPAPRSHDDVCWHVDAAQKDAHCEPCQSGKHVAQFVAGSHVASQSHGEDADAEHAPWPLQVPAVQSHAPPDQPGRHAHRASCVAESNSHSPWSEQLKPPGPTGHAAVHTPAGTNKKRPRRSVGHSQRKRPPDASHVALAARAAAEHWQSSSHARPA